jgi:hypothetical protein
MSQFIHRPIDGVGGPSDMLTDMRVSSLDLQSLPSLSAIIRARN